ncbi:MAG: riboflavin synthase [Polyangiaceae bacterium]|jgi:riboflavin synthase|nr:riboflavin synthase [Polyangiaceae bacterium]MBK8937720.1 riboflavin synthase [Polyangiaceae bacterium]
MFTGLVEEVGSIVRLERRGAGARLAIEAAMSPLVLGESVAVSGVCLTVDRILPRGFEADASSETLDKTTLGALGPGAQVNLERATPLGGRMGGHVVLGHVDATGTLVEVSASGDAQRTTFEGPAQLARYLATKGSIAIDGVSLTLNEVTDERSAVRFSVMLIPHTLARTTLPALRPGAKVNLEVDVLARYVERQLGLSPSAAAPQKDEGSLLEKLRGGGYM